MVRRFVPISLLRTFTRVSTPILPLSYRSRSPSQLHIRPQPHSRFFGHSSSRLTSPPPSPGNERKSLPPNASLSQRLKYLLKSYGWYALGVYLIVGVGDFALAFVGIHFLGAEQVSRVAAAAKAAVYGLVNSRPKEPGREEMDSVGMHPTASGQEGLYAMLVLAYTVHKTLFLPLRVGLTAGLTPKIVKWLRARGWAGGEGAKRAAAEMRERVRRVRNRD